jgi:hypothetical protein
MRRRAHICTIVPSLFEISSVYTGVESETVHRIIALLLV